MIENIKELRIEIKNTIKSLEYKIKHTKSEIKIKMYYEMIEYLEDKIMEIDYIIWKEDKQIYD